MAGGVAGEEKLSCGNRYNVGPLRKTAVIHHHFYTNKYCPASLYVSSQ